jgi:hypothetical protein
VIHYHGTPITPRALLLGMAGEHFCVSFGEPRDAEVCVEIGQSVLWDNGAFSAHTRGLRIDWRDYYRWLEPRLAAPHWAVIPDVIGGGEAENDALLAEWPYPAARSAPVWHLHESLGRLERLSDEWPIICFGSSAQFWDVGSALWERRVDEAWEVLARRRFWPWVHMLRGLSVAGGGRWPFASADSANVARNHKDTGRCPLCMAREIDRRQSPLRWHGPAREQTAFDL